MKSVPITIDGASYEAEEDQTILNVLRQNHIKVPTLCYHPALKPSGACRLCAVEVSGRSSGRNSAMLSCILKVKDGMQIRTSGELVSAARKKAFIRLLTMAPQSTVIRELAREFEIDLGPDPDGCIRCRLCIRVCKEIVGANALKMIKRDGHNYVIPVEGNCIGCGTCVNLCRTNAIQLKEKDNVRTIFIRDEIIGIHPLTRCEGCGKLFATYRFLATLQQRIASHPHVKDPHSYCHNCAKMLSNRIRTVGRRGHEVPKPR